MRYPKLKAPARRQVLIDRFRGYEHLPQVSAGAFYEMENLSGEQAPLLTVRRRRQPLERLDGCPVEWILAVGGRGTPVVLDGDGTLWSQGCALPRLLEGTVGLLATEAQSGSVEITRRQELLELLVSTGTHSFVYSASAARWVGADGSLPADAFALQSPADGTELTVRYTYRLENRELRRLVFLGGWVCIFPDGKYANTVKLRQGQEMEEGVDYGSIGQSNMSDVGTACFEACGPDGTPRTVTWADAAPESGCWVDTSETEPKLRAWSESQGLWVEVSPYVKCALPGIAAGLRAGDGVELSCRVDRNVEDYLALERFWQGAFVLTQAYHDPGSVSRPEGTEDYLILSGVLPHSYEFEMPLHGRSYFTVTRPLPEMDFVVEAANRLWGCRCGGGVNELYGSKLGDFRNWSVFEGLSTDSYRVARGHDGPYTGAAVLGGCPLFFRADCLEKLYPSAAGDHGVVTVSLSGIEAGSAASAVVIGDRLYYKSADGVCVYNGTLPTLVSGALGDKRYHDAVAGAKGSRCYFSMLDEANKAHLFVLDTETGLWYREDDTRFLYSYSAEGKLYLFVPDHVLPACLKETDDSQGVRWLAETGDLLPRLGTGRSVTRLRLLARLDPGAELRVYVSFDGGPWLRKGEFYGNSLHAQSFPLLPRRCTRLRLRLEGVGGMELHQLSWLTEAARE